MVMARRLGRFVGRSFVGRAFNALVTRRIAYLARRAYTVLAVTSLIIGSLIALNYSPLIWRRVSEHFAPTRRAWPMRPGLIPSGNGSDNHGSARTSQCGSVPIRLGILR